MTLGATPSRGEGNRCANVVGARLVSVPAGLCPLRLGYRGGSWPLGVRIENGWIFGITVRTFVAEPKFGSGIYSTGYPAGRRGSGAQEANYQTRRKRGVGL